MVVVGAGPNGLAAAVALAGAGLSTLVLEANATPGGGARTQELTLPGFQHDVCSTVHPLGAASPYLTTLGLERHGLSWIDSPAALAHVLDERHVVTLERSIDETVAQLGADGQAYRELFTPYVERFADLLATILGPLRVPSSPLLLARFGLDALHSMQGLARARFREPATSALLAGIAAHAMLPLDSAATASFALVLGIAAHAAGWPIARGGSQAITNALVARLGELGGELVLGRRITRLDELPEARAYVLDVTPKQLLSIAGSALPTGYRERLKRYRYGAGVFKMDWALSGPVPWTNRACARAATVHLAGPLAEIAGTETSVHDGKLPERPFVLFVQPTLFDPSRAPPGRHIAWAYCHVPRGSTLDASAAIEAQVERFAPGFRDLVLARTTLDAAQMEQHNPNYVGGDINGGLADLGQLFFRPVARLDPYSTPNPKLFLCSSSTPPGGGVHGMCGYWAARSVLSRAFGRRADGVPSGATPEF